MTGPDPEESLLPLVPLSGVLTFAHSVPRRLLVRYSSNIEQILGADIGLLVRDANFVLRYLHTDDRFQVLSDLERTLRDGTLFSRTYRWIRPATNTLCWLHCTAAVAEKGPHDEQLLEGLILDCTPLLSAFQAESLPLERLGVTLSRAPWGLLILDDSAHIVQNNLWQPEAMEALETAYDYSALDLGRWWPGFFRNEAERAEIEQVLREIIEGAREGWKKRLSAGVEALQCTIIPVHSNGVVRGAAVMLADSTREAALDTELDRLRKNEAMHILSAHAAHYFNNNLQSMYGHAAAMRMHPENRALIEQASAALMELIKRSSDLTRQMLTLEEPSEQAPSALDINYIMMSALNKVPLMFASGYKVSVTFGHPPLVLAGEGELSSALTELCKLIQKTLTDGDEFIIYTSRASERDASSLGHSEAGYVNLHLGIRSAAETHCAPLRDLAQPGLPGSHGIDPGRCMLAECRVLGTVVLKLGGAVVLEKEEPRETAIEIFLPAAEAIALPSS